MKLWIVTTQITTQDHKCHSTCCSSTNDIILRWPSCGRSKCSTFSTRIARRCCLGCSCPVNVCSTVMTFMVIRANAQMHRERAGNWTCTHSIIKFWIDWMLLLVWSRMARRNWLLWTLLFAQWAMKGVPRCGFISYFLRSQLHSLCSQTTSNLFHAFFPSSSSCSNRH